MDVFFIDLALLEGEGDEYPEAAFYMMGTLEESFEEGKRLANFTIKKWKYYSFKLYKYNIKKKFINLNQNLNKIF